MHSRSSAALGVLALAAIAVLTVFTFVSADSNSSTFENPPYTLGSVNGQDGWTSTGSFDQAVVANTYGYASFGAQTLRISDAVTSGSFGDQTFSKPLANEAGESDALNGGASGGTRQAHFEASFDLASASSSFQSGMHLSVSPDRGDGARMSYLRFDDTAGGIDVFFIDVQGTSSPANFVETQIATDLSRTPHTIKFVMDFVEGHSNDVVKIYIDNTLVHTGTSWENYYRFDPESNPSLVSNSRTVDSLLFRMSGTATPANMGQGFLIDNVALMSGPITTEMHTVTIVKYLDGQHASSTAATSTFPMASCWSASNLGTGCGNFSIGPTGFNTPNAYEAQTAEMAAGSSYSVNELFSDPSVGASCADGKPYALMGYSTGTSLAQAATSTMATTSPNLTNINSDMYVIVWNKNCAPKLTVTKIVINDNGGTATTSDFALFIDNATTTSGTAMTTTVGTHTVSEAQNSLYTGVIGGDCAANGSVTLAAGESKTCTITNNDIAAATSTVKVHILKYLDGTKATASSSMSYQFPMESTWQAANLNGGATTTGNYVLGDNHGGATDQYGADTAAMQAPAYYSTHELTGGANQPLAAGATCVAGAYRLKGYTTSATSFADAADNAISTTTPAFWGLTSDRYVIVWNEKCPNGPTEPPPTPENACDLNQAPAGYTLQQGSIGSDTVTLAPNTMFVGRGGNDRVTGGNGNYIICLGVGNDRVMLGDGTAQIDAGGGNNTITTGQGDGTIESGVGNDTITTGTGAHTINAGGGNNKIQTGDGNQNITTGVGNDTIDTGNGNDTINAGGGNNKVNAGGGTDSVTAGAGNDKIDGGTGTDTCSAGIGNNTVTNCTP